MALITALALWPVLPAAANGDGHTLEHIVIIWLKEPGNRVAQDRIIEASEILTAIPGVVSLKSGIVVTSDR
ncbi:MAG: hypothetical protein HKM88_03180, partial [Halobacteria archaeon]|nr:hypothetical protein [Halobacteria archaeon]